MKKAFALVTGAVGMMAMAPLAVAQEAPPADPAASAGQAAPAPAAPASSFTDQEIQAYATVAVELNKIQADASVSEADKQSQMAAAVQKSGLDIAKFNAITDASKTDPALQQKLRDAVPQSQ